MRTWLSFVFALLIASPIGATTFADTKRLIVILKDSPSARASTLRTMRTAHQSAMKAVLTSLKGSDPTQQNVRDLWLVRGFAITVSAAQEEELRSHPLVQDVVENREIRLPKPRRGAPPVNEAYTYGLNKLGIPQLKEKQPALTGEGIVVGVVDSGIDPTHPDLKGRLLAFHDFAGGKTEAYDDHGHGTHVSGTIAGGNASGVQIGVAPAAKLVVAKVFDAFGGSSDEIILAGMQWMADPDGNPDTTEDVPAVVNNSWGGTYDAHETDPLYLAVDAWRKLDIFPSFAAGNDGRSGKGTISKPGAFPTAFAVGAVDERSLIAPFSSIGPGSMTVGGALLEFNKPDVCAPGVNVYSSLPGNRYESWSGTSMATPHVTGVVALLRQRYPKKNIDEIAKLLTRTATDLGDKGFDYYYGYGLINALKAAGRPTRSNLVARFE